MKSKAMLTACCIFKHRQTHIHTQTLPNAQTLTKCVFLFQISSLKQNDLLQSLAAGGNEEQNKGKLFL